MTSFTLPVNVIDVIWWAFVRICMSNEAGAGTVEFFPPRFWGLDPLFSAKLKLNIRDVLNLSPYPEFPGRWLS